MAELLLDVRIDGFADPVGVLVRDPSGSLAYAYLPNYVASTASIPISQSLPLTTEPYGDVVARAFFDNLLQESDGPLRTVMDREGLARDDVAGLLYHLGKDCPGALSVLPAGAPPVKVPGVYATDYEELPDSRLNAIVRALYDRRALPTGTGDPSPLAGVQSKIGLTILPNGRFAEPKPGSGAPTTHILKVPDRHHRTAARLEASALDLSRATGTLTSTARVQSIDGIDVLIVTRFDRAHDSEGRVVRLHQEDFAQALGLPSSLKYERRGQPARRFDVQAIRRVLDGTSEPTAARQTFIRNTLFDLLIGNGDGHAKNHAILHMGQRRWTLTPRYDLVPTQLDTAVTDELSYRIGDAETRDQISEVSLHSFLVQLGITSRPARRRLLIGEMRHLAQALVLQFSELDGRGQRVFCDLIASNIRGLLPLVGLDVPVEARDRDAFVPSGGGWRVS